MTDESWTTMRFDDFAERVNETVMPAESDLDRYIGLEHLDTMDLKIRRWDEGRNLVGQKLVVRKGDIIIARRNWYLRRVAIAPFDALCSAHAMIVRPKAETIDPEYFGYFLLSGQFYETALSISVGSLSPTINWTTLKNCTFSIPPLEEQEEKVVRLKELDSMYNSFNEGLENLKIAQNKMREQIIADISRDFDSVRMKELCGMITKGQSPRWQGFEYSDSGSLFITSENVGEGHLLMEKKKFLPEKFLDHLGKSVTKPGDVLINIVGSLGRACLAPMDLKAGTNQAVAVLRPNSNIDSLYLLEIILSLQTKRYFLSRMVKTAQPNLTLGHIREIPVPLGDSESQSKLKNSMESMRSNIKRMESMLSNVGVLRTLKINICGDA